MSESVAQNLLKAGAAEVDYLVSYAPIFHPCFSDPPDKPLAAAPYKGKSLTEIGELVASNLPSINKVRYNSPDSIVKAIGLEDGKICTYCISDHNSLRSRLIISCSEPSPSRKEIRGTRARTYPDQGIGQ